MALLGFGCSDCVTTRHIARGIDLCREPSIGGPGLQEVRSRVVRYGKLRPAGLYAVRQPMGGKSSAVSGADSCHGKVRTLTGFLLGERI